MNQKPGAKATSSKPPGRVLRTLLLLALSLAFFVGGYIVVGLFFPDPTVVSQEGGGDASFRPVTPGAGVIGDVESVTLRTSDPATGAVVAEILIGAYRRTGSSEVRLEDVRATVLLAGDASDEVGGVVTLTSPLGLVELAGGAEVEGKVDPASLGSAQQARLTDVTLRWFATRAEADAGPGAALLTLRVDHLVFDNERFSLYTTDTQIDGRTVLADDVPIVVRGRDYDFDGTGLLARWDASTRRPTLVRIAHGERLVIKTDRPFLPESVLVDGALPRHGESRWLSARLATLASGVTAVEPRAAKQSLYQARLSDNLRVYREGAMMAEADAAEAVFDLAAAGEDKASEAPQAAAPGAGTTSPAKPAPPTPEPFSPITVRWTGPLEIVPSPAEAESAVLTGSPLVLRQEGAEVRAGRLTYDPGGDIVTLDPADAASNVVLVDAEGNSLVAPRLVADRARGVATAWGSGYAEIANLAGAGASESTTRPANPERLRMAWEEQAEFFFAEQESEEEQGAMVLNGFVAEKAVQVRHPEFLLTSDRLSGELAEAGDQQELESLTAEGHVEFSMLDATGWRLTEIDPEESVETAAEAARMRLTGDRLEIKLPEGSQGPVGLLVTGNVQTAQAGEEMNANRLQATLTRVEAAGASEMAIADLEAQGVTIRMDQGGRIESPTLHVTPESATLPAGAAGEGEEPARLVRLLGDATTPARVRLPERGIGLLESALIEARTGSGTLSVPAAGRMELVRGDDDPAAEPVMLSWTERFAADEERVEAVGEVRLGTTMKPREGDDGAIGGPTRANTRSDTLRLDLEAGPTSTTQPADEKEAPELKRGTLTGGVRATIEMFDATGRTLAQSFDLRSERLDFSPARDAPGMAGFGVNVPGAGRILYRDLRPPEEAGDDEDQMASAAGGFRGDAAFGWNDSLTWQPGDRTGVLTMTGEATVALSPTQGPACTIRSRELVVDVLLEAGDEAAGTPATQPTGALQSVTFTDAVRFSSDAINFTADRLRYEPQTGRLIATTGQQFDGDGVPLGQFRELVYNVETGQIDRLSGLDARR